MHVEREIGALECDWCRSRRGCRPRPQCCKNRIRPAHRPSEIRFQDRPGCRRRRVSDRPSPAPRIRSRRRSDAGYDRHAAARRVDRGLHHPSRAAHCSVGELAGGASGVNPCTRCDEIVAEPAEHGRCGPLPSASIGEIEIGKDTAESGKKSGVTSGKTSDMAGQRSPWRQGSTARPTGYTAAWQATFDAPFSDDRRSSTASLPMPARHEVDAQAR